MKLQFELFQEKLRSLYLNRNVILCVYILAGFATALLQVLIDRFNNYKIFRASFNHLLQKVNLHAYYPNEYYDQYLYAPPSTILFAPFAFFSYFLGCIIWNIFTAFVVWYAIDKINFISWKQKVFIYWFILIELITSLQNLQTNHLLAAVMLLSFLNWENKRAFVGGLFSSFGFYIKGFSGAMCLLMPFYKPTIKVFLLSFLSFICVGILPGFFVGFQELPRLYSQWFQCLAEDHKVNYGVSFVGFIHANITTAISSFAIQLFGILSILSTLAIVFFAKTNEIGWRVFLMSYILIWVVLFNHAAESCSYIIAILGVAIWLSSRKTSQLDKAIAYFVFIFTILSATDVFPAFVRKQFFEPHVIKALPVMIIWIKMHFDLLNSLSPLQNKNN
jgi:hypothetical protein